MSKSASMLTQTTQNRPCWAGEPSLPSEPSSIGDFDFPADSVSHPGYGSMRIHAGDLGNQVLVGLEPKEGHLRATCARAPMNSHNPLNRKAAGKPFTGTSLPRIAQATRQRLGVVAAGNTFPHSALSARMRCRSGTPALMGWGDFPGRQRRSYFLPTHSLPPAGEPLTPQQERP